MVVTRRRGCAVRSPGLLDDNAGPVVSKSVARPYKTVDGHMSLSAEKSEVMKLRKNTMPARC